MPAGLSRGKRRLMGEINVVPYIDVMLVLLIIFMVTAPLLTEGVKVTLPRAAAQPLPASRQHALVMTIDREGRLYLNVGAHPRTPLDADTALARATAALRREPDRPVLVNGAEAVSYGRIIRAMVLLQRAGARTIGMETQPPTRHARH